MKRNEKYIVLSVLEGLCGSTMNGDFPAAESNSLIHMLAGLFTEEELSDGISEEYQEALRDYGGITQRATDRRSISDADNDDLENMPLDPNEQGSTGGS